MKRNLAPLSLLAAGLLLLNSVPVLSQQQVAAMRRSDITNNEARKTGLATPEEYSAEISRLKSRKTALQKYISTVDPASNDFLVTARSVREIDLRLKELDATLQTLSAAAARKLTLAENAYLGKYRAEVKLKIDPAYTGDVKLTVIDRLGSEVFSRTLTSLMRGVNDYTTIVDLTEGQNIVVASSPDDKELSNSLLLLGGNAQPAPEPAAAMRPRATAAAAAVAQDTDCGKGPPTRTSSKISIDKCMDDGTVAILTITADPSITRVKVEVKAKDGEEDKVVDRRTYTLPRNSNTVTLRPPVRLAEGKENTITVSDATPDGTSEAVEIKFSSTPPPTSEMSQEGRHGNMVGLLVGGVVMSQQAENFSQADPFMGFTAGYSHFNARGPEIHWRVQGIFQVQPKKEEAPKSANATATPSPTPATTPTPTASPTPIPVLSSGFTPFLASRKTFDVDMRGWVDWPFPGIIGDKNEDVRIGVYGLVGASTYIDKSELRGDQDVKVKTTAGTPEGEGGQTELDTERARIDNDLDMYREFGMIGNFYQNGGSFDRKLFMQASIGYGHYESLKDLDVGAKINDTRHRFIGRLRLFPKFLDPTPAGGASMTPMFGVEINAGTGPDQIKFFTGIASAIKLFK